MRNNFKTTWQKFRTTNFSLGMREKIAIMWIIIIIIMGISFAWQSEAITRHIMVNDLQNRGISIARDVAAHSAQAITAHNLHELAQIMTATMENNTDLVYIYLLDAKGSLIINTQSDAPFAPDITEIPAISTDNCFATSIYETENGRIHDITVPTCANDAGTVRLGIAEHSLEKQLVQTRITLTLTIMAIISIVSLITMLYTNKLLSPLQELTAATESLSDGNFNVSVPVHSQDEIGQLATAFNSLVKKLGSYKLINRKNQAELDHKDKLREELVKHLITAQEEERKRIARELHDETSQSLTALKLGLKTIEETTSPAQIIKVSSQLREMLGATLGEITAISRNLRPSVLDDMGLHAALVRFIEETSLRTGENIVFKSKGLANHRFPFYLETALYRIIQEAVTNCIKYAKATNLYVSVNYENKTLKGVIHDNGVGFNPSVVLDGSIPQRGLGLFGMQERAALIGGTLNIDSAIGHGTTITISVPHVQFKTEAGD